MSKPTGMPAGRPAIYTEELAATICSRLSMGESLRSVCRDEDMPGLTTVFTWFQEKDGFRAQYETAKIESADSHADLIVDMADNIEGSPVLVNGEIQYDKDGEVIRVIDAAAIAHAKLKVDARKWAASKLKPRKYGEKLAIGGDEDAPPIKLTRTVIDP